MGTLVWNSFAEIFRQLARPGFDCRASEPSHQIYIFALPGSRVSNE